MTAKKRSLEPSLEQVLSVLQGTCDHAAMGLKAGNQEYSYKYAVSQEILTPTDCNERCMETDKKLQDFKSSSTVPGAMCLLAWVCCQVLVWYLPENASRVQDLSCLQARTYVQPRERMRQREQRKSYS